MLLDRYRQLLTAYVDGELSSRQRRHVVRLLHRSAEARRLLRQLEADAKSLRDLPRPALSVDSRERSRSPHRGAAIAAEVNATQSLLPRRFGWIP